MKKLSIITLMGGSPWGGSEELWCDVAHEAISRGFEVQVSVLDWGVYPPKLQDLNDKSVTISKRPIWQADKSLYKKILRKTASIINTKKSNPYFDIATFNPDFILISQGGTFDFCQQHKLQEIILKNCPTFVLLCHNLSAHEFPSESTRQSAISWFPRAKFIGFVSEYTRALAQQKIAHNLPNSRIVKNPVNLVNRNIVEFPDRSNRVKMACVSELTADRKGQDILFQVLSGRKWQELDWELNIFGTGKDESYFVDLARYYNISEKVRMRGFTRDIRQVWGENEILIMPSRVESAPLALVEAMICGRPAVATPVGGIPEWIEDGETGYLAASASFGALDEALHRAWQDKKRWREIGRKAHDFAIKKVPNNPGSHVLDALTLRPI